MPGVLPPPLTGCDTARRDAHRPRAPAGPLFPGRGLLPARIRFDTGGLCPLQHWPLSNMTLGLEI